MTDPPRLRRLLPELSLAARHARPRPGGAVTVDHGDRPDRLADDPFARLHPARILRLGPGLFGHVLPPPGPAIQRDAGKPWPVSRFDNR